MSLLRTLLILGIIYYSIRFIGKFVFPLLVNKVANNAQKKMQDRMEEIFRQQNKGAEGEISITRKSTKKKNRDDEGDFVDYEEVK